MNADIEKLLHKKIKQKPYNKMNDLPIYIKGSYSLSILEISDFQCLLAEPKGDTNLATLNKHYRQLRELSGMECVFLIEKMRLSKKRGMIEKGLPFIAENQAYLPFLGIVLNEMNNTKELDIRNLSFLTQRFLLLAIYNKWQRITLTDVAKEMKISKMSVTRCFDELDALDLRFVQRNGTRREFVWDSGTKSLWAAIAPKLRNPVTKEYRLDEMVRLDALLGGMSAMSHHTMINDNSYVTYACSRAQFRVAMIENKVTTPKNEIPQTVVQILRYIIPDSTGISIDPLSAILSLSDSEKEDARVESAIETIFDEVFND